ncbi:MAG: hypothetical protein NWE76_09970 [Candidatus Bathyarchaeota archaeon]|nr:hypothetical protein [Candidatus Bathyarchaeota archaeon]
MPKETKKMEEVGEAIDSEKSLRKRVDQFSEMLDHLTTTEEKKKYLWREIYENAIQDRENAAMLFTDAWSRMSTGTAEHVTIGPTLTKYLERMCKSNEQILRLAELISKAEEREAHVDPDDIFSSISGG